KSTLLSCDYDIKYHFCAAIAGKRIGLFIQPLYWLLLLEPCFYYWIPDSNSRNQHPSNHSDSRCRSADHVCAYGDILATRHRASVMCGISVGAAMEFINVDGRARA